MKPENPIDNDQALHRALREWELKDSLPPRFRERVWQRIARADAPAPEAPWTHVAHWLGRALARPALALSYVTVLLVAGLLAGYWQAQAERARTLESLSARYVQVVDPYQAPRR